MKNTLKGRILIYERNSLEKHIVGLRSEINTAKFIPKTFYVSDCGTNSAQLIFRMEKDGTKSCEFIEPMYVSQIIDLIYI
jgi:hypothetical protein